MRLNLAFMLCACLMQVATAAPTAQEIIRQSCERESRDLELRRQYTWRQHGVVRQMDKKGGSKDRDNKVLDVFFIDGTEYRRVVEKDGKPLPEKEAREEQAKIDKAIGKHKRESADGRRKRQEKDRKELEDERRMRREIPNAFNFELLGEDSVNGRPCWKVRAEPKPGYKPTFGDAKFLPKVHGTLWVDKENYEWAKVDAESLDSFSVGLGLLRIGKGFRLLLEQQFVNNEIWAPVSIRINANARAMLFIGGNFDINIAFKDYRKYSVSSTVTVASEDAP
ncbi:MAG: hypothetical protein SGI92_33500 [Bryobacteraceae bacterium]|nr:hypothetical protein [Bryobacteraceae bacterium]